MLSSAVPAQAVLNAGGPLKNALFMREVNHVVGCTDMCMFAGFVLGLPTVGGHSMLQHKYHVSFAIS